MSLPLLPVFNRQISEPAMLNPDQDPNPTDITADAFRCAIAETPLHLRPLASALSVASQHMFDAAIHARYEQHTLMRSSFGACREQLEQALALLAEAENAPDADFGADLV